MNDHNLDDLIIDNIEPKNSKTKSFLTIIALLIVVLIVAIILTKIILKDPNAEKIAFEENNTEMISPELTLQSAAEPEAVPKPKKEETKLSTIIESELNPPAPVEEVAKETVEITKEVVEIPVPPKVQTEVKKSAQEEEKLQKEYDDARKARLEQEKAAEEKAKQEKAEQAKAEQLKIEQEQAKQKKAEVEKTVKPVPASARIIEKAKVKPAGKPLNVPAKSKSASSQTYYIQVGSFTKTPSTQFLSVIKKSGFNYKITPKAANGTKKLLIGPYKNRASANSALSKVKDRINKNAFVVKK